MSPTPVSAPWTSATVGSVARGFENASYQQDEEPNHQQQGAAVSASCPPSTSGNGKVSLVSDPSDVFCPSGIIKCLSALKIVNRLNICSDTEEQSSVEELAKLLEAKLANLTSESI